MGLPPLKLVPPVADTTRVEAVERNEILRRYLGHTRQFEAAAATLDAEYRLELTAREFEVLQLLADGLANHEIAKQFFLSVETVKTHVRSLLAKLQARSRAHAVAVGFRRQLIS